jgi:uncharacterized lipoprotein YehR (DUF1307 family)
MNKKSKVALILIVSTLIFILSSCGEILSFFSDGDGLNGTYVSTESYMGYRETYKFKGDKITLTNLGASVSGTFKIEGNKIKIKWNAQGLENIELEIDFEQKDNSIFIDGQEYVKK